MSSPKFIGIDLGTTFSVIAHINGTKAPSQEVN